MPVNQPNQIYNDKVLQWEQVEDCINDRVKQMGTKYLPKPNPGDSSTENQERYNQYKQRALFMNVTRRTHEGFIGMVYRKPPVIELPPQLEYLADKSTLDGLSLTQFSKMVSSNGIKAGRGGVLAEYPQASEGMTRAQTQALQAYLVGFSAQEIINWRVEAGKLVLVVIEQMIEVMKDQFTGEMEKQYLVLAIDESGYYYQQKYNKDGEPYEPVYPRMSNGALFPFIPFTFVGTVNNDARLDPSLLYSISELNIGHYRNSADLEENCFIHGQLTLGIQSDLPFDDFKAANPAGIQVGSRSGHFLGSAGAFHAIQADANQLAEKLQLRKEEQMAAIGARLIEKQGGVETAEAVKAKAGADSASLSNLARNVSEAITLACEWCGLFMGAPEGQCEFALNQDFYPDSLTAQEVTAAIQLFDRGAIAASDLHERLQQGGWLKEGRTLEMVQDEIETTSPLL